MKKISYFIIAAGIFFSACNSSNNQQKTTDVNPLLQKFETPFETPPFQLIKNEHFVLAYEEAMKQQNADIEKIASNPDAPTFTNTIEAYDASGSLLNRIESIFNNLTEVNTNDTLQQIAKEISPKTSAQKDNILLNASLFKKIKTVYEQKANLNLNPEQTTLVNEIYKKFVRGGANLTAEQQKRLREINERLAFLGLQFGENLLAETNGFTLVLDKKEDLVGLPDGVISAAAEKAKESGNEGKWVFGLDKPSLIPFLQYSEKRELREKLFKGYSLRGNNNNKNDNKKTVNEFVNLRLEKANLFGFKTYADYILDDRMAKNTKNVYNLLDQVWIPSLKVAKTDAVDLQKMIDKEGGKFKLEPWDWWFYSEKIRKQKYN